MYMYVCITPQTLEMNNTGHTLNKTLSRILFVTDFSLQQQADFSLFCFVDIFSLLHVTSEVANSLRVKAYIESRTVILMRIHNNVDFRELPVLVQVLLRG